MSGRKISELSSMIAAVSSRIFIACLILSGVATGAVAKEKAAPQTPSIETLQPKSREDINQLLSRLSDEQVRQILIQQLEKSLPPANQSSRSSGNIGGMCSGWNHSPSYLSSGFRNWDGICRSFSPTWRKSFRR